jgi:hypothetical protein
MALKFTQSYLEDSIELLRYYKRLADGALAQTAEENLYAALDSEGNSIAIIMKHMSGSMCSRFSDFLTSDGEKPTRNRDGEFEDAPPGREELLAMWEKGWECVLGTLSSLQDGDLSRTVTIRGEAHSVMQAINRQLAHYPHHVGQIVLLAKHFAGSKWRSLSVPRGASIDFNRRVAAGEVSQR